MPDTAPVPEMFAIAPSRSPWPQVCVVGRRTEETIPARLLHDGP